MARRSAAAVETLDDADDDLDVIEEAPKPKRGAKKATAKATPKAAPADDKLGASWLATYTNQELGTDFTPAQVRVILRKMAGDGTLSREVGVDRTRYEFSGESDRTVKAFIKRVQANPDEAKANRAERIAVARGAKAAKAKKTAAVEELDEAPAPKPARRKRAS